MTHHTFASLILAAVAVITAGATIAESVVRYQAAVEQASWRIEQ